MLHCALLFCMQHFCSGQAMTLLQQNNFPEALKLLKRAEALAQRRPCHTDCTVLCYTTLRVCYSYTMLPYIAYNRLLCY